MAAPLPLPGRPQVLEEWAFVLYAVDGPPVWHQRWRAGALAGSSGSRDIVVTPDRDVYEESLHLWWKSALCEI